MRIIPIAEIDFDIALSINYSLIRRTILIISMLQKCSIYVTYFLLNEHIIGLLNNECIVIDKKIQLLYNLK